MTEIYAIPNCFQEERQLSWARMDSTSWVIRRCSMYAMNCELRLLASKPLGCLTSFSSSSVVQLSM